ncbi:MAG: right-handed parallel beta-helix repeat-containing protein [Acidobacteriaceae bacterium]|nr:right-handed parallel beta-helix repeat-containing protein [Acidobacteriaceae bacterium]
MRSTSIVSIALLASVASAASAQIFVAPNGKDSASGTRTAPLKTLDAAVRKSRHAGKHEVHLQPGTYRLTQPVVLTAEDSGLKLIGSGMAAVTISGGVQVTGWKADAVAGRWSATLPAGVALPRQIYVNGVRATRTRGRLPVTLTMTATGYEASSDVLSTWHNPSALEMVYTGGNAVWGESSVGLGAWTEPRCPVASIEGKKITMAEPCWTNSTKRVMLPNGKRSANLVGPASVGKHPVTIENAYELLGRPGEFYADPSSRKIYYTPRKGEELAHADVEVPALDTLLSLDGTAAAPVENVTVRGITFAYANWQSPNTPEGFSEIQANFRVTGADGAAKQALCTLVPGGTCPFAAWTPEPANVRATYAHAVHFERDSFTHLGAAGLSLMRGSHDNLVEGCRFTDISGNGVALGDVDTPEATDAEFAIRNRIENNLFTNVGAEFRGGIPIVVGYARYTRIAHNHIERVPYAAISIGWGGWGDKIELPGVANRSTGNVIEYNRISQLMMQLADGGGIYTQGRTGETLADGERVTGNVIDEQVSTGHAMYSDNGSAMITYSGNVVFHTNFDNWGSRHKDYYDGQKGEMFDPIAVLDNWWEQGDHDNDTKNVVERGNHLITSLTQVPAAVLAKAGLEAPFRDLLKSPMPLRPAVPPSSVTGFIAGDTAYVSWRPPVDDGGSRILSYRVSADDGSSTELTAREFTTLAYAKLPLHTPGAPHTFTVTAINAAGASVPSLPSRRIERAAKASALPGPMQHLRVLTEGSRASIHFGMPTENGEELLGVVVAVDDAEHKHVLTGHRIVSLEGRHVTFMTLDNIPAGKHRFGIAALTAYGEGKMQWVEANEPEEKEK